MKPAVRVKPAARIDSDRAGVEGGNREAKAHRRERYAPVRQHLLNIGRSQTAAGVVGPEAKPNVQRPGIAIVAARHARIRAETAKPDDLSGHIARREVRVRRVSQRRGIAGQVVAIVWRGILPAQDFVSIRNGDWPERHLEVLAGWFGHRLTLVAPARWSGALAIDFWLLFAKRALGIPPGRLHLAARWRMVIGRGYTITAHAGIILFRRGRIIGWPASMSCLDTSQVTSGRLVRSWLTAPSIFRRPVVLPAQMALVTAIWSLVFSRHYRLLILSQTAPG
jgi:hypothetical protein